MARKVILGFRLRALKEAKELAKAALVDIKESATLSKQAKREMAAGIREQIKGLSAQEKAVKSRKMGGLLRLQVARVKARQQVDFGQRVSQAAMAREKGMAMLGFAAGSLGSLGGMAAILGGPAGMAAGLAIQVADQVFQKIKASNEKELQSIRDQLAADLERRLQAVDYEGRMKRDPYFRRAEARKTFNAIIAEETAMARDGLSRSADFLVSF